MFKQPLCPDDTLNISFGSVLSASTPVKQKSTRTRKPRVFVRPVCDVCEYCRKEYRNHKAYLKHVREHKIKDNASCSPNLEEILNHLKLSIASQISKFSKLPSFSANGIKYKDFISALSNNEMAGNEEWSEVFTSIHRMTSKAVGDTKILLPSALVGVLQNNVEELLSNVEERNRLCGLLQNIVPSESAVIHQFIADYVFSLIHEIILFMGTSMRKNLVQCCVTANVIVLDKEDLESIHYISGSVVRGFFKKSKQFPKNAGWCSIGKVIEERLLESDTVPGPPEYVKGWTIAQNRGRLFFVSGVLFNFFCGVTELLEKDTSHYRVNHELILEEVCKSTLLILWDDAVGDSMTPELGYSFMCGLVRSFGQTFGVGKAKKIINAARDKAEASLPLRHKVAPR